MIDMNNSITVTIPFFFKGVEHAPKTVFNLENWVTTSSGELPDFCQVIAQENGIGSYTYELEVMESSEVVFENPQGFAIAFYNDELKTFDFEGFKQFWLANQSFGILNDISQRFWGKNLALDSIEHQALVAAFMAGKNN